MQTVKFTGTRLYDSRTGQILLIDQNTREVKAVVEVQQIRPGVPSYAVMRDLLQPLVEQELERTDAAVKIMVNGSAGQDYDLSFVPVGPDGSAVAAEMSGANLLDAYLAGVPTGTAEGACRNAIRQALGSYGS